MYSSALKTNFLLVLAWSSKVFRKAHPDFCVDVAGAGVALPVAQRAANTRLARVNWL